MKYTKAWWGLVSPGAQWQRLMGLGGVLLLLVVAVSLPAGAIQLDETDKGMPVDMASVESAPSSVDAAPLVLQGTVQRGQSMYILLQNAGVGVAEIATMQRAVRRVYDISLLRVGHLYRIELTADGGLRRLRYKIDLARRLEVERQGTSFVGRVDTLDYELRERVVQGVVHGSLYDELEAQGEPLQIAADLVEIFAGHIDFHTDLRDGDAFRVLIAEQYRHAQRIGYRRILAAELVNRQRVFRAVYYAPDDESNEPATGAYYRPDGHAMQRMFLRSPLHYTRISSKFSYRRFHPVLKRYRPHLGVDYAAPRGTVVRSVADGIVKWVGRRGAGGNMVKIQHRRGYMTYYLHLSRFARGLRAGKRVKQGQVIGYVGSTGLSTGPHLDFRIKRYGKYLNPLRLKKNSAAPPLPRRALPAFQAYAARTLAKLTQVETVAYQDAP